MSRSYEKTLRYVLLGLEIALLSLVFYGVWVEQYNPTLEVPLYRRGNYFLALMYAIVLLVSILGLEGQALGEARLAELVTSQCIALFLTTVLVYFPMSLLQYRLLNPLPILGVMLMQIPVVVLWNFLANKLYFALIPPLRVLLVSDGTQGMKVAAKLNRLPQRYVVDAEVSVAVGREYIRDLIDGYDAVLVAVQDDRWRTWLTRHCFKRNIRLLLIPTLTDVFVNSARVVHAVDSLLMCSTNHRLSLEERAIKRAMDVVISLFSLLLCSPLFLVVAFAVKLDDGGPVLFRQERLTRDGKVFSIYKFRSMRVDEVGENPHIAMKDDPRITRVGRWLRKYHLDELPQFVNVLKGEMSIVGPRPECPEIAAEYEKEFPEFSYRLKVKAGITGYAQIYGNYTTDPADKLLMDVMYIERSNFVLDLTLIFLTIRTMVMTDKTRGKECEQIGSLAETERDDESQIA